MSEALRQAAGRMETITRQIIGWRREFQCGGLAEYQRLLRLQHEHHQAFMRLLKQIGGDAQSIRHYLTTYLPEFASKHVAPTMVGNAEAADHLAVAAPNYQRGAVAVAMWRAKIPAPAFHHLLGNVWGHDHAYLFEAAGNRRTLRAMFRYADLTLADDMPSTVRAWRGTSRLSLARAGRGLSWTLNRDVACWFAMRFAKANGSPLVLAADVPRAMILHYSDERNEQEVVIFDAVDAWVDGDADDWQQVYERRIREKEQAYLKSTTRTGA